MNFFYSAAVMGYGDGRAWHHAFDFPELPTITQTLTRHPKRGYPFAIVRVGQTVYNHVAHHNVGISAWLIEKYHDAMKDRVIVSIAGTDDEIEEMTEILDGADIRGIQLSFSCPNVTDVRNRKIPKSRHPIWLKLNHKQDPYKYDLDRVKLITVNSVPCWFGGMSGKGAQKYNWEFIKKFNYEGLDVAGSSFLSWEDIRILRDECGCTSIGIGTTILLKPRFIERLLIDYDNNLNREEHYEVVENLDTGTDVLRSNGYSGYG